MANPQPAPKSVSKELLAGIMDLQMKAMAPGIPVPQRQSLKNRAQELGDQVIELEASRFNKATEQYKNALQRVEKANAEMRTAIKSINNMIKVLDKASKLFGSLDGLLKVAAKFIPIG